MPLHLKNYRQMTPLPFAGNLDSKKFHREALGASTEGTLIARTWVRLVSLLFLTISFALGSQASDVIPKAAWRRPLGQPLSTALGKKPEIKNMIDDGYWQGAPVGG